MYPRRLTHALIAVAAAAGLAGCGGSTSPADAAAAPSAAGAPAVPTAGPDGHDPADVAFAQAMIPHHRQAVAMAALAPGRAGAGVAELAARIRAEQQPEIDRMTAMLTRWGAGPAPEPGSMPGMDHGSMPGMMSDAQMSQLGGLSGSEFDRRFLTMMIAHHQGAVDMSATELAQGRDPDARELATSITTAQRAEIDRMRRMLTG